MERILLLGCSGMLGQALMKEGHKRSLGILGVARSSGDRLSDLTDDRALCDLLEDRKPQVVINAAAMTDLNVCERDPGSAYRVNARLPAVLAEASRRCGFFLVQISTDHYFTGDGAAKHDEGAPVRLVNDYARSKFAGESFALTAPEALILRTNIIGFRGRTGQPTFLEWVIEALTQERAATLFDDYYTSSIDVGAFSAALFDLLPRRPRGLLNLASSEVASKRVFVETFAARAGLPTAHLSAGKVRDLPGPARAESLGLDVTLAEKLLGRTLPDVVTVVDHLIREYREKNDALRQLH